MRKRLSEAAGMLVTPVIILAMGVIVYLFARTGPLLPENKLPIGKPAAPGFREGAKKAGITFSMNFAPGEQGEKFKADLFDHGSGVAIGDYDNDGKDDIYFLNQVGPNALYRNMGDGTFKDVAARAGVALGDRVCVAAAFADYDNDGYLDLYVTTTRGGNVLFHNNRDGTFTDVTEKAGLTHVGHSQTATFFDYDNDGRLDLLVTNTAQWSQDARDPHGREFPGLVDFRKLAASRREFNVLYHNNGDGTFTDVTEKAGLRGKGWGGDVAVFDYNEDGHLDVLITNMFGASQLYRNNGDATFTEVTREVLGRTSWGAIGARVFDFNNDGRLDLFLTDNHSDMWLPTTAVPDPKLSPQYDFRKKYSNVLGPLHRLKPDEAKQCEDEYAKAFKIQYDDVIFGNTLFKKLPSGKFKEVSDKAGLETFWPWGIATGDFDNDGFEDVFLPSGMGYPFGHWPNSLMMNNGNETFTDRAAQTGIEPPPGGKFQGKTIDKKKVARSSRCAAVADFDGDGRLDLVVNNFNDHPYFFHNEFPKKNWVAFRLTGTKSNRDAIGALVKIYMGKEIMTRQVQGAGGYLSQSSRMVHFGLGDRQKIDRVEILWPDGKKTLQTLDALDINRLHLVTEPK